MCQFLKQYKRWDVLNLYSRTSSFNAIISFHKSDVFFKALTQKWLILFCFCLMMSEHELDIFTHYQTIENTVKIQITPVLQCYVFHYTKQDKISGGESKCCADKDLNKLYQCTILLETASKMYNCASPFYKRIY